MGSSAFGRVGVDGDQSSSVNASDVPRHLRIRFEAGTWLLSEDGPNRIGGAFASLASAVDFARGELRGVQGGCVVLELGAVARDERPRDAHSSFRR